MMIKTFIEFRREWVMDPSKEMIVEKEIKDAYNRYLDKKKFGSPGYFHYLYREGINNK